MKTEPILITGIPRSGASMIAGVLNICGTFGGRMTVGNTDNRGAFENVRIGNTLVKPYLLKMKADGDGQYPLPDKIQHIPTVWSDEVNKIMRSEGYTDGPWMYKDSRTALIWPVWTYAYPNAKWIIVRRRTGDIIQSCVKTSFMHAFKDARNCEAINVPKEIDGWLWWIHQYEQRFVEMITEGVNCKVIWPERMINGDFKQLYELLDWLGLSWKVQILTYIDTVLNTKKKGVDNGNTHDS